MDHAITLPISSSLRLSEAVRRMRIDIVALSRPLRRCDLAACRGTCCHDGAYLEESEEKRLRELVPEAAKEWEAMRLNVPEEFIIDSSWRGAPPMPKTAIRSDPSRRKTPDYPSHFPTTSCIFLLPDARCALQVLAMQRKLPAWSYKPLACWMHPLVIEETADRISTLTLHDESSDPQRFPDYDGFVSRTPCGQSCAAGEPAWQVLREELTFLGNFGDRDLYAEIATALRVD